MADAARRTATPVGTRALPYVQVDAFADRAFTGNPAAVMRLDAWPGDALLQAIAAEHALSETAFMVPARDGAADFELRWFTPDTEVQMCGHATLASGHVILSEDPARDDVRFATRRAGLLKVARDPDGAGAARYLLDLPVWRAQPRPLPAMAKALGGPVRETLWHDSEYALFTYDDARAVRGLSPDLGALAAWGFAAFIATAPGAGDPSRADVVSRVFVPGGGVPEDPVTGSAHAVLAPYWCGRLGRDRFSAFQASRRGGHVCVRLAGDRAILSGGCVTVASGVLYAPT